jgi:hypothetical protein
MFERVRRLSVATAAVVLAVMAFAAVAPANHAAAQGETKTETIALEPFSSIQIEGGGSATLTIGDTPSVTITGNSLIVDQLDARVENGQLVLGSPLTSALDVTGLSELTYEIVAPAVEEIHLAGTVTLDVPVIPAQSSLVIGLTTGANLNIDALSVVSLTGKMDLLSKAKLAGAAETMQLEINNGSELDAAGLQVGSADLVLNGVAKATVRVTEALTGRASQGSTVHYISESVTPEITTTTLAAVSEQAYTPWVAPAGMAVPAASPEASPAA